MDQRSQNIAELNKSLQENPTSFFQTFGGLHDTEITSITFTPCDTTLIMVLDDLYANFLGLPEYRDLKNVELSIEAKIVNIDLDVTSVDQLSIYDIEFIDNMMKILFSPSGVIKINCTSICFI